MDNSCKEYLERQVKEAEEAFDNAKAKAIKDLRDLTAFTAVEYGTGYAIHVDKITAAAARWKMAAEALRAYNFLEGGKE